MSDEHLIYSDHSGSGLWVEVARTVNGERHARRQHILGKKESGAVDVLPRKVFDRLINSTIADLTYDLESRR
jgi:hypothetical protein